MARISARVLRPRVALCRSALCNCARFLRWAWEYDRRRHRPDAGSLSRAVGPIFVNGAWLRPDGAADTLGIPPNRLPTSLRTSVPAPIRWPRGRWSANTEGKSRRSSCLCCTRHRMCGTARNTTPRRRRRTSPDGGAAWCRSWPTTTTQIPMHYAKLRQTTWAPSAPS